MKTATLAPLPNLCKLSVDELHTAMYNWLNKEVVHFTKATYVGDNTTDHFRYIILSKTDYDKWLIAYVVVEVDNEGVIIADFDGCPIGVYSIKDEAENAYYSLIQ